MVDNKQEVQTLLIVPIAGLHALNFLVLSAYLIPVTPQQVLWVLLILGGVSSLGQNDAQLALSLWQAASLGHLFLQLYSSGNFLVNILFLVCALTGNLV